MADDTSSELIQEMKQLFNRLEEEVDEVAEEGKAGIESASTKAKATLDQGADQSKESITELQARLDEIESELDEHLERGKEAGAETIRELRVNLRQLEDRLRE